MVYQVENIAALLRIRSERLSTVGSSKKGGTANHKLPSDVVTLSEAGKRRAVAKAVADRIVEELAHGGGGKQP